jgi:antitoxin component YwqK of YwqJK toxin-antitoxin module
MNSSNKVLLFSLLVLLSSVAPAAAEAKRDYCPIARAAPELIFKNGQREGTCKYYFDNGKLQSEIIFRAGESVVKEYHVSGTLYVEESYKNGRLVSQKFFDEKGKPVQNGIVRLYYENGRLREVKTIQGGRLNGVSRQFYPDGTLKGEYAYTDGVLNGISRDYYRDGVLSAVRNFKNGRKEGISRNYYENGNLFLESSYKNGLLDGASIEYDKSGTFKESWLYREGRLEGKIEEHRLK